MLFTYPLMSAVQIVSARMRRTTGRSIAGNLRHHCPAWLLTAIVSLLLIANVINIGADIGAAVRKALFPSDEMESEEVQSDASGEDQSSSG